ncbi:MAG TPA: DUF456 domain-containing protein [Candidatus Tidjanibacter gallistercoris]|nr:DUF456 domain-containing protein [Candidatus Tidjanibacter gallistercoris]
MDIVLTIAAVLCCLVGIAGCFLPVLPGPPIAWFGLLLAHWTDGAHFSGSELALWAVAVGAVTLADYFLPAWITGRLGGSRQATRGAAIGTVAGLFFMPWGVVLGPFLGALAGELLHDRQDNAKAFRVAFGSFLAFALGTGLKLVVCVLLTVAVVRAAWC